MVVREPTTSSAVAPTTTVRSEPLRINDWQRNAARVFVPLTIDPVNARDFRGRFSGIATAEATAVLLEAQPHRVERTAEHLREGGRGFFKFSLQLEGEGLVVQGGRESTLRPGDLTVYDTSRPYTLTYDDRSTQLVLMVPHDRFGAGAPDVVDLVATRLGVDGLADVVVPVLTGLARRMETGRADTGLALVHHAVDLVETLCRDDADRLSAAAAPALAGPGRNRELRRVLRYIDDHLGDPALTPQTLAAAHFISVRSLHKLFDDSGTTAAALIRSLRMERAKEALSRPSRADVPIGQIAAECGLPDAAHFSRVFRSTFGLSPSQVRSRALARA
jgi:AraC-like DNA-binding protein